MDQRVCTSWGFVGVPRKTVKGSFAMELVLWLFFLLPGFLYSLWRLTTKHLACPKCKNATMIPVDSPMGKKLVAESK